MRWEADVTASTVAAFTAAPVVVPTPLGDLSGIIIDTPNGAVRRFAGIPYGEAPVGQKRFCAPTAVKAWTGVRSAADFGPAPMQALAGLFSGAVPGMGVNAVDEDCLSLNIWVPDVAPAAAALPVLVWVYGGAFVIGGTSQPTYDGARLCSEQNVVVVTVNYRLGAFGFLDLRSVPGGETADTNCGIHDIRLALQWVADNVSSFGGDPRRVTAFGESAGAGCIMHLLTTPGISGLLDGAIAQSPGIDFTQRSSVSNRATQTFLDNAEVTTVDELRELSADTIVEAQVMTSGALLFDVGTMVFHPVVDDVFVTESPSIALAAGAAGDVALLIGYTADELRLFPDPRGDSLDRPAMARWAQKYLVSRLGRDQGVDVADELVGKYLDLHAGTSRPGGSDVWCDLQTDGIMRQPPIRLADSRPGPAPTFVYQFNWQSHIEGRDAGAFHAIDLPFVFDTFDVDGWGTFIGADDDAKALAHSMRSAWVAFVATGDPSCDELGTWPRFTAEERQTMVFDAKSVVVTDPLAAQRGWWDGLWDADGCRPSGVPL